MICNLYKKIISYCWCKTQDNDEYNIVVNNNVNDEKFHRTSTSVDNSYSLSNEAFTYSDVYR